MEIWTADDMQEELVQTWGKERALKVRELILAGMPQDSRASAQHKGHAHHTTNCSHMEHPVR